MSGPPEIRRRGLDDGLWVAEHELRSYGVELGRRMTVVRLADGGLWLHSVCRLVPEVRAWLDALGPVRFIVSPTAWHHFWMEEYARAYPEAELWAAPGLAEKRPDLELAGVLGGSPAPGWGRRLDMVLFTGNRIVRAEAEFLHRPSRTLILGDLCFHVTADAPLLTRVVARALGVYRRFGPTREFRWATRDRRAARAAIERILAWDFDRVIVAHGAILETDGPLALRRAFAWLLDPSGRGGPTDEGADRMARRWG